MLVVTSYPIVGSICSSIREGQGIRRKNGTRARMQQHWRERLSDLVVHGAGLSSVPSDALNVKLRMPTVVVDTIDEFERFEQLLPIW
ncbi:uncharacterized protein STEHIDRAFT_150739 [Stereum hirsutum FP-91666 SS1]|uniref:Uncharacterized protein n=1 Tax=Stereum hirsutum (strain FP-91666) TaxID=721885 RepID=R7RXK7_STEHR|nr:uncharacterized protein STEHIDRAFT_150739 [Stereum hirsutum FP-91666 SS1]EIM80141.1 hypothetical protein STEHIDRAFT_150739 [Stereum hirsutum FP-91666 SS1]